MYLVYLVVAFIIFTHYNRTHSNPVILGFENFETEQDKRWDFYMSNNFPFEVLDFDKITPNQFEEICTSSNSPVLFKNTLKFLPTFNDICYSLRNKKMRVRSGNYGSVDGRKSRKFHTETMKQTCDNIKNGSKNYGGNNVLNSSEIKRMGVESNNEDIKLRTPLHKDGPKNLALQVYGNKTWRFFNSNDNRNLCFKENNKSLEWSNYELGNLSSCPSAKNTKMFSIEMTPGDMLYLPKQWAHDVTNNDNSIMMNYWYSEELDDTAAATLM